METVAQRVERELEGCWVRERKGRWGLVLKTRLLPNGRIELTVYRPPTPPPVLRAESR